MYDCLISKVWYESHNQLIVSYQAHSLTNRKLNDWFTFKITSLWASWSRSSEEGFSFIQHRFQSQAYIALHCTRQIEEITWNIFSLVLNDLLKCLTFCLSNCNANKLIWNNLKSRCSRIWNHLQLCRHSSSLWMIQPWPQCPSLFQSCTGKKKFQVSKTTK